MRRNRQRWERITKYISIVSSNNFLNYIIILRSEIITVLTDDNLKSIYWMIYTY